MMKLFLLALFVTIFANEEGYSPGDKVPLYANKVI